MRAMNYRDGLAPVSLAVERPVIHLILNALFADTLLLKIFRHLFDGFFFIRKAVEEAGIRHFAVAGICFLLNISALDDLDDVNAEFFRELPVSLIVGGDRHNGARSVAHHYIIGDIDGDFFAVYGIHSCKAFELYTGLFFNELSSLKRGFL